jgi:iron complex outermembrane receptor protein
MAMVPDCSRANAHLSRCLLVGAAALLVAPGSAGAQVLDEIVVTAQKREQNLQDVAVSVTAFSGAQMQQLGLSSAADLVSQTPGLQVSGSGGGAINTFSVRGVTQNDFAASQEGPVAVYIDEGYVSLNSITNFSLFDMERAEVLRGPQGTLFGRNATGGLVHYITKRPTREFEGHIDLMFGEDGRKQVEAAVSGGITDTVSGRLSGVWNEDNGLIKNDIGPNSMRQNDYSIRGQLLFEPSEDLKVLLKLQYADEDAARGGYSHRVAADGEFVDDPAATDFFGYRDADGDPFTGSQDFETKTLSEVLEASARIEWRVGDFTVTSVTNFQDIKESYFEDADVSPNDIYNYTQFNNVDQISQELRLSWETGRTRNTLGAYYLNIDGRYNTIQGGDVFFGTGVGYPAGTQEIVNADQKTKTWALFGQTEFDFTDRWSITLGLRYNSDKKDYDFRSTDIYFLQGGNFRYTGELSDHDIAAKAQLNWRPTDDWLVYAGYSRGIKSGGFNLPLFPIAASDFEFGGEVLDAYEIGFKASLTDKVRLNASAYYYDYHDYQAYSFDGFATFLFNASARSYGGELELAMSPVEGLDVLLGLALLDSKLSDVPPSISPTGKETAALAPKVTVNGLVRYAWPAFGGSLSVQGDFSWKDDHNFNLSFTPVIREKAYGVVNARVGFASSDERWSAAVFVKNLTNTSYRSYAFDTTAFFGATEDVPGLKRWFGGSISYKW